MAKRELAPRRRRRLSLSFRISVWLMFAALFPLIITVASSELQSRPSLINQANIAMESDVSTRVQLIDTYFTERLLDAATLTQVPTVQAFLALSPEKETKDLITRTGYTLAAGIFRDKNYSVWSLFDAHDRLRLYYPSKPQPHGLNLVPPEDLQTVLSGKEFITPVYFDPQTGKASVDIYAPVALSAPPKLLGFMRATLRMDYVWNIVKNDLGANGAGSYAFILDQNGVRIADTDSSRLFTAIAPLAPETQQAISSEQRYGGSSTVPVLADKAITDLENNRHAPTTLPMTPAGQNQTFQVTWHKTSVLPWTYFVLSPLSTVTAVADKQLFITIIVAAVVLFFAMLGGFWLGRQITRPIRNSVDYLHRNSEALNTLATRQASAATEQTWVVDSSQMGLQSVQYYTNATSSAAHQMNQMGTELEQRWHQLDIQTVSQALGQMITASQYIEKAAEHQTSSNQKLATAIKVTTQVTEQLAMGATSAADTATQLEDVVGQLENVVGG